MKVQSLRLSMTLAESLSASVACSALSLSAGLRTTGNTSESKVVVFRVQKMNSLRLGQGAADARLCSSGRIARAPVKVEPTQRVGRLEKSGCESFRENARVWRDGGRHHRRAKTDVK